jgi:hypothetical protein
VTALRSFPDRLALARRIVARGPVSLTTHVTDQPRRPRAMPQQRAIGAGRNVRRQLGLDDELEGWPA